MNSTHKQMPQAEPTIIYVDARCLQDSNYRFRGVGQHSTTIINALRLYDWHNSRPTVVGIVDEKMGDIVPEHCGLFDELRADALRRPNEHGVSAWFISLSPMTHNPVYVSKFLVDDDIFRVCLFYDLIPLEFGQRYLARQEDKADYVSTLAWLSRYDVFAAISNFTARGLIERLAIDPAKIFVSGVAVRPSLEPQLEVIRTPYRDRRYFVIAGGGDPRKNPECAVIAHARSDFFKEKSIHLMIFGNYPEGMRAQLRALYASHNGLPQNLTFISQVSDSELHHIYRNALATIVSSRAEGFSIPIIESSAAGTPVLASDVGAHPELVKGDEWRFDPDAPEALLLLMEKIAVSESDWNRLEATQLDLWKYYTTSRVGNNLICEIITHSDKTISSPFINKRARPSIAVMTPLPPALSGVADYSESTLKNLCKVADIHIFTSTLNARWDYGWKSLNNISAAGIAHKTFDKSISVMGNSYHHREIFTFLKDYGGACIAHDARQLDFYYHDIGIPQALTLASKELGRSVSKNELETWIIDQAQLPTLFLSELLDASSPLITHSMITAEKIQQIYNKVPTLLPFAQYRPIEFSKLEPQSRLATRDKLGIDRDDVIISTFGIVSEDKAPNTLVRAIYLLHQWGLKAHLVFCGFANHVMYKKIIEECEVLDVKNQVTMFTEPVSESLYQEYLLASDIAVQLRKYHMGGLSGALNDAIAAALPSIANEHLAKAMDTPNFVTRISDEITDISVAEAVLEILKTQLNLNRPIEEAKKFAFDHSPNLYCVKLLEALGFDETAAQLNRINESIMR